jgi:hypothetical protein
MAEAGDPTAPIMAKLRQNAGNLGLGLRATEALATLARDPHGIDCDAATSLIASGLDVSRDEAKDTIIELQKHGMLSSLW